MRQEQISVIIRQHANKIKILWLIIAIIAMIMAIRTYTNYTTIKDAITNVEYNIDYVEEEIAYTNKFLKKYLDSEYADYFLAHKNNILFYGEYIVRFESPKEVDNTQDNDKQDNDNIIETPQESRIHFIKSKLD